MTRKWLVIGKTPPPGWPRLWMFPREKSWPPGWPKRPPDSLHVRLVARMNDGVLTVQCLDRFDEPTDELEGEYLQIAAGTISGWTRICRSVDDSCWYEGGLIQIHKYGAGDYGCQVALSFDLKTAKGEDVHVDVSLYGITNHVPVVHAGG